MVLKQLHTTWRGEKKKRTSDWNSKLAQNLKMDCTQECETKTFRSTEKFRKIHASQYSYQHYLQSQATEVIYVSINRWMVKDMMCVCVCICMYVTYTHLHTREYYSATKKDWILSFATTWVDLEYKILSEISQRKTNTV